LKVGVLASVTLLVGCSQPKEAPVESVTPAERKRAMGVEVFFTSCNLGTGKKLIKNPLTGEESIGSDDPGLSVTERATLVSLLKEMKGKGPDEFGVYSLLFADGGEAELFASGLVGSDRFTGCMVETHGLTPDVAAFMFRLSRDGNMIMQPALEGVGPLVTSDEQRQRVAVRFPDAKVVLTAAALEKELYRGFESWAKYRDQVIGDKK
jgi:hypothetical protein